VIKAVFAGLLILVFAVVLFVIIAEISRRAALHNYNDNNTPTKPIPSDSNAQWASYYRQMANQVEQTEPDSSAAAEYRSLARMYETLDTGPEV
jgi:hypothetical protein